MASSNKLLSIIIPTYNNADYIVGTLLSLHKSITSDVEIILINDGSTDSTDEKIKQFLLDYPDHKVRYIHKENQGVATTRNVGLANANGKYIGFVDGDDLVSPEYFSELLPKLQGEKYDIVEFNLIRDINELYDAKKESHQDTCDQYEIIVKDNDTTSLNPIFNAGQWHLVPRLFHRRIIINDRFEDGHRYEDMSFVPFQYFKCSRILKINKYLYFYRVNTDGITENINKSDADNVFFAMKKMYSYIKVNKNKKDVGTLMIVKSFMEGRKLLRKSIGYYRYDKNDIILFQKILAECNKKIIDRKIIIKMKHPYIDKLISYINYKISIFFR